MYLTQMCFLNIFDSIIVKVFQVYGRNTMKLSMKAGSCQLERLCWN